MSDLVATMVTFHRNEARNEGIVIGRNEGIVIGRNEERKATERRLNEERKATERRLKNAAREFSREGLSPRQIAHCLALDPAIVEAWLEEERP